MADSSIDDTANTVEEIDFVWLFEVQIKEEGLSAILNAFEEVKMTTNDILYCNEDDIRDIIKSNPSIKTSAIERVKFIRVVMTVKEMKDGVKSVNKGQNETANKRSVLGKRKRQQTHLTQCFYPNKRRKRRRLMNDSSLSTNERPIQPWTCSVCTFINDIINDTDPTVCGVCECKNDKAVVTTDHDDHEDTTNNANPSPGPMSAPLPRRANSSQPRSELRAPLPAPLPPPIANTNNIMHGNGMIVHSLNVHGSMNNTQENMIPAADVKKYVNSGEYTQVVCCNKEINLLNFCAQTNTHYVRLPPVVRHIKPTRNRAHTIACKCGMFSVLVPGNSSDNEVIEILRKLREHIYTH
eukprot:543132_1